jgi:hypothetical protein
VSNARSAGRNELGPADQDDERKPFHHVPSGAGAGPLQDLDDRAVPAQLGVRQRSHTLRVGQLHAGAMCYRVSTIDF